MCAFPFFALFSSSCVDPRRLCGISECDCGFVGRFGSLCLLCVCSSVADVGLPMDILVFCGLVSASVNLFLSWSGRVFPG